MKTVARIALLIVTMTGQTALAQDLSSPLFGDDTILIMRKDLEYNSQLVQDIGVEMGPYLLGTVATPVGQLQSLTADGTSLWTFFNASVSVDYAEKLSSTFPFLSAGDALAFLVVNDHGVSEKRYAVAIGHIASADAHGQGNQKIKGDDFSFRMLQYFATPEMFNMACRLTTSIPDADQMIDDGFTLAAEPYAVGNGDMQIRAWTTPDDRETEYTFVRIEAPEYSCTIGLLDQAQTPE